MKIPRGKKPVHSVRVVGAGGRVLGRFDSFAEALERIRGFVVLCHTDRVVSGLFGVEPEEFKL